MAESRRGQAREEYEPELAASHQRWVDLGEEVVDAMTDKFVGEAFDRPKTLPMCIGTTRKVKGVQDVWLNVQVADDWEHRTKRDDQSVREFEVIGQHEVT
ncbi:unnamed protein product [Zymoseptoria tritici ST99CH_1A5]|uniref:Uncharacterized protein n=2 Tax=Zymoseptoria tritici TaxID=1047171 RepID=A0A2H1GQ63_ZYMTR|nr:unnamed protein product [Zymoseptoria tritici ST99CH_1E4]SMY26491.1 unnamed protein product [Zymoseptoria tritici ST99CH_1A5]